MRRNQTPTIDLGSGENIYFNEYRAAMYQCVKEGMRERFDSNLTAVGFGVASLALFFFAPVSIVNVTVIVGAGGASMYYAKKAIDMKHSESDLQRWLKKNPNAISPEARQFFREMSEEQFVEFQGVLRAGMKDAIRDDLRAPRVVDSYYPEAQVQTAAPVAKVGGARDVLSSQTAVPVASNVPLTQTQAIQAIQASQMDRENSIGNTRSQN